MKKTVASVNLVKTNANINQDYKFCTTANVTYRKQILCWYKMYLEFTFILKQIWLRVQNAYAEALSVMIHCSTSYADENDTIVLIGYSEANFNWTNTLLTTDLGW